MSREPATSGPLPFGVPTLSDYRRVLDGPLFDRLEAYSAGFLQRHAGTLAPYGRRWVGDPLHQWSRQWEYPYVFAGIEAYAKERSGAGLRLLDAGSGVTFFPFFLAHCLTGASVQCCDSEPALRPIFAAINDAEESSIDFLQADIGDSGLPGESIDVVYCVSVLEHAAGYQGIVDEFARLLVPGGLLLVTFDICLDGRADIPPAQAESLLAVLEGRFEPFGGCSGSANLPAALKGPDVLTSRGVWEAGLGALPWRFPRLMGALSDIRQGRWPAYSMRLLTVYCASYRKAGG